MAEYSLSLDNQFAKYADDSKHQLTLTLAATLGIASFPGSRTGNEATLGKLYTGIIGKIIKQWE